MKKMFKALSVLAATAAVGTGVAFAAGCNTGLNGTYQGEYHYTGAHGSVYGMVVEVTVENNIITKVRDITNTDLSLQSKTDYVTGEVTENVNWTVVSNAMPDYGWLEDNVKKWTTYESKLLQQYEGWSVADILDIKVFIKETGEVYDAEDNAAFNTSGLLIGGATQSSGRLLLAVQDAARTKRPKSVRIGLDEVI